MAIIGLHSLAALLFATVSLAIVSAAIALPQWLRGYYSLAYCYLGLFKISIGNEYGDVAKYLPQFEEEFRVSAALVGVADVFLLVVALCVVASVIWKKYAIIFILFHALASVLACIFLIAVSIYFSVNIADHLSLDKGFGWYGSLFSIFTTIAGMGSLMKACCKSEFDTKEDAEIGFENPISSTKQGHTVELHLPPSQE